jgi:hypothetical protein
MGQRVIIMELFALIILPIPLLNAQEQPSKSIFNFECGKADAILKDWGGGPPETIHIDSTVVYSGKGAIRLERDLDSQRQFTTITKRLPIDFEDKTIVEAPERIIESTVLYIYQENNAGSGIEINSLSRDQIMNLTTFGKVWGFLKYHHPDIASGK